MVITVEGQSAASVNFTVTPTASLSTTNAVTGTTVTVTGNGFAASSVLTVTGTSVTLGGTTSTNANGVITGATFTVPNLAANSYNVVVKDAASNTAPTISFTIPTPTASISPTTGNVGQVVALSGSNFPADQTISATYAGSSVTLSGTTTTTSTGGIPTSTPPTFVVPASAGGAQGVVVNIDG